MLYRWHSKLVSIIGLLTLALTSQAMAENVRPNIVVILLDDLGYADVGFMEHSAPDIYTPNIDQLAEAGTVLTQAYVTHPYCGPSRAGLMTGRYQHQFGAQFNLAQYSEHGVDEDETLFSTVLQDAGYRTGLIGKWHLGEDHRFQPNQRGFDYFYGMLGGGHKYHTSDFTRVANYTYGRGWDYEAPLYENGSYAPETNYNDNLYITDMFTDKGVEFIDGAQTNDDQPFLLFMSYNAPHTPEEATPEDEAALREHLGNNASQNPLRHTYSAMVYAVDRGVERLVNKLKDTGEYDNTVIVFFSDNGGRIDHIARANNNPLNGIKGNTLEGGIRVPMFISWPAGNLAHDEYHHPISSLDLYPTFLALAGAEKPVNKVLDGKDVLSNIQNNTNARSNEPLYFMRHHPGGNNGGENETAVILNNQKWYTDGSGTWVYYDLNNDMEEQNPISINNQLNQHYLLDSVYLWSQTHIRPAFFDASNYGFEEGWNRNDMPNFAKTFPGRYDEADYINSPNITPTPGATALPLPEGTITPLPDATVTPAATPTPNITPSVTPTSTPNVGNSTSAEPAVESESSGGGIGGYSLMALLLIVIRRVTT